MTSLDVAFEDHTWQWFEKDTGEWHEFLPPLQHELNEISKRMLEGGSEKQLLQIDLHGDGGDLFHFDLRRLTQENTRTGKVCQLRRMVSPRATPGNRTPPLNGAPGSPDTADGAGGGAAEGADAAKKDLPDWFVKQREEDRVRLRLVELRLIEDELRELGGRDAAPQAYDMLIDRRTNLLTRLSDITGQPALAFTGFNLEDPADLQLLGEKVASEGGQAQGEAQQPVGHRPRGLSALFRSLRGSSSTSTSSSHASASVAATPGRQAASVPPDGFSQARVSPPPLSSASAVSAAAASPPAPAVSSPPPPPAGAAAAASPPPVSALPPAGETDALSPASSLSVRSTAGERRMSSVEMAPEAEMSPEDLAAMAEAKYNEERYICHNFDKLVFSSNHDASACMSCAKKRPNRQCQACSNAVCDACSKDRHPRHPNLRICRQCFVRNENRPKVKSSARDAPVAVKIGFMKKRGEVNRSFAKRLFLLDSNGNLVYYKFARKAHKEGGTIPMQAVTKYVTDRELSDAELRGLDEHKRPFAFGLETPTRTFVLSVATRDHLLTWRRLLCFAGELCWGCGHKCDDTSSRYVVLEELTRVYHLGCFTCHCCDAPLIDDARGGSADEVLSPDFVDDSALALDASFSSVTSSGSSRVPADATFEVAFELQPDASGRLSRGFARMVCAEHAVGADTEVVPALVCSHLRLSDNVYKVMLSESSYFVRKQVTLRGWYADADEDIEDEDLELDEDADGGDDSASADAGGGKGSNQSRLLACALQGVINSVGEFSPFADGCSTGFAELTPDDVAAISGDMRNGVDTLARVKEAAVQAENEEEAVFEAVRQAKIALNSAGRPRRYAVKQESLCAGQALDVAGLEFDFMAFQPEAFAEIRRISGISADDFRSAFTHMPEGSLGGGASGMWVKPTHDRKFIMKPLPDVERRTLLELLPAYLAHLRVQPCTLLCRFVGLYEVRHRRLGRLSFVVMENILGKARELDIHELYDLKGSTVARRTQARKNTISHRAPGGSGKLVTQKDMDLSRPLIVGERAKMILNMQITTDIAFLNENRLMDFSLLVGIHNCADPCPQCTDERRDLEVDTDGKVREAQIREYGIRGGGPPSHPETPESVYFFGIIDLLQKWTSKKRLERKMKVSLLGKDGHGISAVNPDEYAVRFQEMLTERIEGGELRERRRTMSTAAGGGSADAAAGSAGALGYRQQSRDPPGFDDDAAAAGVSASWPRAGEQKLPLP